MENKRNNFSVDIQPYIPKFKQLAIKLSGNSDDAKDLIQESLIKIYPLFYSLDPQKNISAWIAKVVYNTHIDLWRKQQKYKLDSSIDWQDGTELYNEMITHVCPLLLLEMKEEQRVTTEFLYQLKNEYRTVLILHDIEGYTTRELAAIFSLPIGTIKSRLFRARAKLREMMQQKKPEQSEYIAWG